MVLTCNDQIYSELKKNGFYGLTSIPAKAFTPWQGHYPIKPQTDQGCVIASPVAFTGKVFQTVPYVHPASPALNIAAFIFDNLSLHTKIREKGGAYGGGSASNAMSGNFYFYSYRDPNIVNTLTAFEEAIEEVSDGEFDDEDLEEAKLEMIQSLDSPVAPGSQGEIAYSWLREGRPLAIRQAFRDKLLDLDREDIIKAVKTYIAPNYQDGATVVFAGQELLEKENKALKAKDKEPLEIINI